MALRSGLERRRLRALNKVEPNERTNEQTHLSVSRAPVGAKTCYGHTGYVFVADTEFALRLFVVVAQCLREGLVKIIECFRVLSLFGGKKCLAGEEVIR